MLKWPLKFSVFCKNVCEYYKKMYIKLTYIAFYINLHFCAHAETATLPPEIEALWNNYSFNIKKY